MFKFLHTADIHLDSPLLNLDRYDGAPVEAFRNAARLAFDNLVDLAIDEDVRFVLIAGDLYDGDCRDSSTPIHFRRQMVKLGQHDIRVFIIQGNHDAGMRREFRLQLPDNVRLFSTRKPETHRIEELRVAVHGQGFAERAVTDDLSQRYPDPVPGWLNIGLLHTSCGSYEAHDCYAPSSIQGLTNKGYQYWALGHIHKRQHLAQANPWIIYPGNIQGRHIREEGPKGCVLVTVQHGEIVTVRERNVDVVRWQTCQVDVSSCSTADEVTLTTLSTIEELCAAADDRPLAVRVELNGATAAHRDLMRHADHVDRTLRDAAVDRFDDRVWIEKIKLRTRPIVEPTHDDRDDAFGQLIAGIRDMSSISAAIDEVRRDFEQVFKHVPTDPRVNEERIDLEDSEMVAAMSDEVKELLIGRLLEPEESA